MHIEHLNIVNARKLSRSAWDFAAGDGTIRKWTVLPRTIESRVLLNYVARACAGTRQMPLMEAVLPPVEAVRAGPVSMEFVLVRHAPQECGVVQPPRKRSGWRISRSGDHVPMGRAELHPCGAESRSVAPHLGVINGGWLFLGYGPRFKVHADSDAFDFADPHWWLNRFASLNDSQARLTDPIAFLERLHHKGVVYGRGRSLTFLARLNLELSEFLDVLPEVWLSKKHDFRGDWRGWTPIQKTVTTVVLDAARHVLDASAKCPDPFEQSGVLVLQGVEKWCPSELLPSFLSLMDSIFSNLQFLVVISEEGTGTVPPSLWSKTLPVPVPSPRPRQTVPNRIPRGTVLLVDVDSQLPNLALMKLSRHFKNQGKRVRLARAATRMPKAEEVHASCVFAFPQSARRVDRLRQQYGDVLRVGGSGVDIKLRLAPEIENLPADYSLYPALGDRAIGFLTRGCPLRCRFCIVPVKEGKPRIVSDLDSLLQGRRNLILLDDNILSHPEGVELMEEMLRRDLRVNFNQTLDLRLLTTETAGLLRRIRCSNVAFTRRNYYFSLNNARGLDRVRRHYEWLETTSRDNVEFVCMYGFDTTLAEDVKRFQFLRSLPGAYVFLQRYRPVLGGPEADLSGFFGEDADEQIDALLRVNFTQNMKSMEVYYRWLCLLYARQRGRIHFKLVETLFRYNRRQQMGRFLGRLENLRQEWKDPALGEVGDPRSCAEA